MRRLIQDLLNWWDRFFFAPISLLSLGVCRFLMGFVLLVMYGLRQMHWRFYFTDEGFVQSAWALDVLPEFYHPIFHWYPTTPAMAFGMHVALLIALFGLMIGFRGRWMALIAWILHLGFMQRNFSIAYGADIITDFFLFYLALADNSRCFSLDSWLRKKPMPMGALNSMLSTIGVRLIQIQLCLIYGYTGMEKLKGGQWWDGTAVWAVFGNQQIMMFELSWMMKAPILIAIATHSALLFEVYFPVLIWLKSTRKWAIGYGWLMHSGIAAAMGLFFFSGAMMSTYLVFFDPDWLKAKLSRFVPERLLGV